MKDIMIEFYLMKKSIIHNFKKKLLIKFDVIS